MTEATTATVATTATAAARKLYPMTLKVVSAKPGNGCITARVELTIKGQLVERTAKIFGSAVDTVGRYFKEGKTVEVTGRLNGGLVVVHGRRPGTRAAEAAKLAAAA